jgi:microcystin-dependent protein
MAQADGTIQNDTGANVRSDLNNNFSALFTNNSGASAPGTTFAYMWYADTTNNQLKIRNGANDGFITVGDLTATNLGLAPQASPTFTGTVSIPAGSAAAPSLRFSGDTDTGLYNSASNVIDITAAGTRSHYFSQSYSTANVPLRVPDGTAAAPSITNSGDENTGIFFGAADEVSITTGGTERAQFDSNGLSILAQKPVRYYDADNSHYVELKAASTVSANVSLTLPTSDGDADQYLKTNGSGVLSWGSISTPASVPTGSVFMMATSTVPSGYLECNGAAVSRTTYSDLFSAISTTWGSGNGSTTFNLPDLRGEFVRGWDHGKGTDSGRSFASSQADSITDHTHEIEADGTSGSVDGTIVTNNNVNNSFTADGGFTKYVKGIGTFKSGSSTTAETETRPRNIAMMYVIKT